MLNQIAINNLKKFHPEFKENNIYDDHIGVLKNIPYYDDNICICTYPEVTDTPHFHVEDNDSGEIASISMIEPDFVLHSGFGYVDKGLFEKYNVIDILVNKIDWERFIFCYNNSQDLFNDINLTPTDKMIAIDEKAIKPDYNLLKEII